MNKLITRKELAYALGKHELTISRWIKKGCPFVLDDSTTGRHLLFCISDVRKWINANNDKYSEMRNSSAGKEVQL